MSKSKKQIEETWTKEATTRLKGKTITLVRYLSEEEQEGLGWYSRPVVIQFDDGTLLFPSRDDEGNDGGALFGQSPNGEDFTLPVI